MSVKALEVTEATFETEVLKSETPVMVDFWAVWCGPCKQIGPIIEDLADNYAGKVKVVKVDIDSNPNLSMKYSIRSIPTILFFKNGNVVDQVVGAYPRAEYDRRLKTVIE
ncbi:MAG: thioredoxin [Candidatus Eisenbacteria bacterium]|nr:thioredoxin [Candidatus Eisenbacteria bacterium]